MAEKKFTLRRGLASQELQKEIEEALEANKHRYGSPRITGELQQKQSLCREKRVARSMRDNGLATRRKKAFRPRTTLPGQRVAPNHIKDFEPSASVFLKRLSL